MLNYRRNQRSIAAATIINFYSKPYLTTIGHLLQAGLAPLSTMWSYRIHRKSLRVAV